VRPQLDDLIHRGWATETPATTGPPAAASPGVLIKLTIEGRAAHARVAERVRAFRAQVTAGLSEQDYTTLVTLLERVAGNLTPA
jgi:DNA-binding MarR family transcriptional regulator